MEHNNASNQWSFLEAKASTAGSMAQFRTNGEKIKKQSISYGLLCVWNMHENF